MPAPQNTRIVHNGNTRFTIYIGAAIVLAGAVVATLISLGILNHDQVDAWMQSVVTIVVGLVGTAATLLAALNRAPSEPSGRHAAVPEDGSVDFARHEHE